MLILTVYKVLDLFFMLFILSKLVPGQKQGMMGAMQQGPQAKKFDIIKNVKVKFDDVAGLHESKREVQ